MNWVSFIIYWGFSNIAVGTFLDNNMILIFGFGILFGGLGVGMERDKENTASLRGGTKNG